MDENLLKEKENKSKPSSNKRIGAAKEEMKDFDISLEEFNAISTPNFGLKQ